MKKYILLSALVMMFMPLPLIAIPVLGSIMSYLYIVPLGLIGGFLGSTQMFINGGIFLAFPNLEGWPIVLVSWFIIGSLTGYIIYSFRSYLYTKKNLPVPAFGLSIILVVILLQMLSSFMLIYAIRPFARAEEIRLEAEKQRYLDENCEVVYTKKSNYKVTKCTDGTVRGDAYQLNEYDLEEKSS